MRRAGVISALVLAACTPEPQPVSGDPVAVAALRALPAGQYQAQVQLASQIAGGCPQYDFNTELDLSLNAERNGEGRGSLAAARGGRAANETELDVATRSLQARSGLDFTPDNYCAIGASEVVTQTALSAVLIPR